MTRIGRTRAGVATAALALTALTLTAIPASADRGVPSRTDRRTVERTPSPTPTLTGIRTGEHAAYDRVVLDLDGLAPGYDVHYVRQVRQDGSGKVLRLRGDANLLVRLTPTDAHDSTGAPTYDGPHRIALRYPNLREVRFAGDFEATVTIALGLRHKAGFRVLTLHDPTRIAIDVAH